MTRVDLAFFLEKSPTPRTIILGADEHRRVGRFPQCPILHTPVPRGPFVAASAFRGQCPPKPTVGPQARQGAGKTQLHVALHLWHCCAGHSCAGPPPGLHRQAQTAHSILLCTHSIPAQDPLRPHRQATAGRSMLLCTHGIPAQAARPPQDPPQVHRQAKVGHFVPAQAARPPGSSSAVLKMLPFCLVQAIHRGIKIYKITKRTSSLPTRLQESLRRCKADMRQHNRSWVRGLRNCLCGLTFWSQLRCLQGTLPILRGQAGRCLFGLDFVAICRPTSDGGQLRRVA